MSLLASFVALAATLASEITLAPIVVVLLTGTGIPILVGIVTRAQASAGVKQAVTVVLVGAATLLAQTTTGDGSAVFSLETLVLAFAGWVTTIAMYHGVYKPHDLNDSLQPDRGIGTVVETTGYRKS